VSALAERMREGEPVQGLIVKMPAPSIVEMAAYAGFDFVLIDAEHGLGDGEALEHHVRAADAAGVACIVRVGELSGIEILRALDAGATGIVVPHVGDAETAAEAVRCAHYPPLGARGLAVSTRAGHQGARGLREHLARAERETLVLVQVEDADAVGRVDEITAVPRLDAVFLGPTDLSLSLGHPGDLDHPAVATAIDRVTNAVVGHGGPALCVLARDEEDRAAWLARGARMILFAAHALFTTRLREVARDTWRYAPAPGVPDGRAALDSVHPQSPGGPS
jgi:4-hydroxy-2-oxoheptanedioate aldolase